MAVIGAVQETGQGSGPLNGWLNELEELHTRQRLQRSKAVANMVHSAATLVRPRIRNLRAPCCSLMIPKTGSMSMTLRCWATGAVESCTTREVIGQRKCPRQLFGRSVTEAGWQQAERVSEDGFRRDLWVVQVVRSLRGGVFPAALEAVALAVHLQDVDVVGEPVQQRAGETLRAEDLGPLVEGQVGGGQDVASLVYTPGWNT